jgi:predicted alpha/beta-hydrolase family hydrolase
MSSSDVDAAADSSTPTHDRGAAPDAGGHTDPAAVGGSGPTSTGANAAADSDAGGAPAADGGNLDPEPEDTSCLDASGELNANGRFEFHAQSTQQLELWLPKLPAGCRAPVVHFANGTGASCANYKPVLERLASHGFLSVCAENPNTGSGAAGMQALTTTLELFPDLAAHKLGSAGHEAGGQGAILTLQQAEAKWGARAIYAGMAIAPSSGHGSQPPSGTWQDAYANIRSPMLMMSGTADALVSERWVGDGYELLSDTIEAYWYSGIDAPHIPIPNDYIQELAVAWFRWKLLADAKACEYFKQLPASERWDKRAEQNAQPCH